jgi:hypothetical protein
MKTIGIVVVKVLAARTAGVLPSATMTSTSRATRSAAMATQSIGAAVRPPIVDHHVTAFDVAGLGQAFAECGHEVRHLVRRRVPEKPNHRHRRLLRACSERPRCRRAAEQRDELASSEVEHGLPGSGFTRAG